ncbi:hypothetical protein [Lactococcus garvieae]|uniref:AP2-like integrase N-terminal domain-containing protein n=1 Tax=Lactococcus garvieae TaxID=1363 RepID=A0A1I4GFM1_9LACT|nr:hypothetical protein [Lactococcus garvieae]SFL28872.1 hypothetical protein SAMN05216438_10410 [Lactococcus garvieae]
MWIVQITGYRYGHKVWLEKHSFKTKAEAEYFKSLQKDQAELYKLEYRKI